MAALFCWFLSKKNDAKKPEGISIANVKYYLLSSLIITYEQL